MTGDDRRVTNGTVPKLRDRKHLVGGYSAASFMCDFIAFSTRAGDIGTCVMRTPAAARTALPGIGMWASYHQFCREQRRAVIDSLRRFSTNPMRAAATEALLIPERRHGKECHEGRSSRAEGEETQEARKVSGRCGFRPVTRAKSAI